MVVVAAAAAAVVVVVVVVGKRSILSGWNWAVLESQYLQWHV